MPRAMEYIISSTVPLTAASCCQLLYMYQGGCNSTAAMVCINCRKLYGNEPHCDCCSGLPENERCVHACAARHAAGTY
jgi:hypothetical protein